MAKKTSKKAAKKTSKPKRAEGAPMMIVGSKVKEFVKGQGCKNSFEVLESANAALTAMLTRACQRATENKRSTVRGQDF